MVTFLQHFILFLCIDTIDMCNGKTFRAVQIFIRTLKLFYGGTKKRNVKQNKLTSFEKALNTK